jgi:hypothetical protein
MQVNTDSVSLLHKAVLEAEIQILKSKIKPNDTGNIYTAITVLESRISELKGEANG